MYYILFQCYKFTAIELSSPDAENKNTLFDWQMENKGADTIKSFGGLDYIAETLNSDLLKVFF